MHIERLIERARRMGSSREVEELVADLESLREDWRRQARHVLLGELVRSTAHDLNQPLTAIRGFAQILRRTVSRSLPDRLPLVDRIIGATDRMARSIEHLSMLARPDEPRPTLVGASQPLDDAVSLMSEQLMQRRIDLTMTLAEDLPSIWVNRTELERALLSILSAGRDQAERGSRRIEIAVARTAEHVRYTIRPVDRSALVLMYAQRAAETLDGRMELLGDTAVLDVPNTLRAVALAASD